MLLLYCNLNYQTRKQLKTVLLTCKMRTEKENEVLLFLLSTNNDSSHLCVLVYVRINVYVSVNFESSFQFTLSPALPLFPLHCCLPWLSWGTCSLAPRRLQSPIIRRAHIAAHKGLIYLCLFQPKIKV